MQEVTLRPLTPDDAMTSCRWRNDETIWKHTYGRPDHAITEDEERMWIEKVMRDKTRANFAIMAGKKYIGNIYLVDISGDTSAMGVFIGEKMYHGHGYGREAIKLLKEEARNRGIKKIVLHCSPGNVPAIISYLKSGAQLPASWSGGKMLELTMHTD